MYDSIIIGAGMSGLAAGIRLAMFQERVLILERHSAAGGLNSFYRLRGRDYDVGLHAVTNFRPKGSRQGPLVRLLRQLRLRWDDLALAPQVGSSIVFPGARLDFNNDFDLLRSEVRRQFPRETDGLERLVAQLADYGQLGTPATQCSARQVVGRFLDDPLLVEMLFCPLLFYGGASEGDMDFGQFSLLFRSIYLEGLARPREGIRRILTSLARKFRQLGGELRLRAGVERIVAKDGRAEGVVLDDGCELATRNVLSSAGWRETMRLCGQRQLADQRPAGRMSFIESISVLDRQPKELGFDRTTIFFCDSERLPYCRPEGLADTRCGLVCSPNNFLYDEPLGEGIVRIAVPANYDRWAALDPEAYRREKRRWYDAMTAAAARFVPGIQGAAIDHDLFTPLTVRRFTGHDAGAIYGIPQKQYDGTTHLRNLFLCGTDQGLLGIVGATISGITMANRHVLGRDEG
jgi:phytoene dehydrogenase-like protein